MSHQRSHHPVRGYNKQGRPVSWVHPYDHVMSVNNLVMLSMLFKSKVARTQKAHTDLLVRKQSQNSFTVCSIHIFSLIFNVHIRSLFSLMYRLWELTFQIRAPKEEVVVVVLVV